LDQEQPPRTDRRKQTFGSILYGALKPRRQTNRRTEDDQVYVLDLHETGLFFLGMSIVVLSMMDAFFTLNILAYGGEELNLVMKALLDADTESFLLVKYWATSGGVIMLIAMARMRFLGVMPVKNILQTICAMYSMLIIYELYLLVVEISILSV
jgi:hypothetical protein